MQQAMLELQETVGTKSLFEHPQYPRTLFIGDDVPHIRIGRIDQANAELERPIRIDRLPARIPDEVAAITIQYRVRSIATVMDFATIWFVVGDVAAAAGLAAFGFVVGPLVYYGHEKAWDYFSDGARGDRLPQNSGLRFS